MTDLAKLVVRLEAEIGKYQEGLDKANKQLRKFESDQRSILGDLAGAFAAYFAIDKLEEWGKHILDNGDHLAKFSQSTGIAVDQLSRLEYGLKSSGVESENAGKLLRELNKNISDAAGNAKGDAAAAFKALGINVRDSAGHLKDENTILIEMADKFAGFNDGANKSALATQLLGKAGASAIPYLNQGADGLRRLADESDRLGATLDGDTAKAAEEFNSRLDRMKTLVVDGIGNAIAKELLPSLNELGDDVESSVESLDSLNHIAEVAAAGLKLLASAGLVVGRVLDGVGEAIGAATAAQIAFLTGNFKQAATIVGDYFGQQTEDNERFQKRMAAIWQQGGDNVLREVKVHVQRMREEAPNLAATKEIEKAAEEALKKLGELHNTLAEQVSTFGLGENEALRYRLTIGNLSDEVKAAGAAGVKLRDSILGEADALQKLKDTKEITKALADVQGQIESLRGSSADAAVIQFDAKNAELVTKLRREGNTEGQKQLDTLLTLIVAQADYNELNQQAARIQGDLAIQEERLNNSRDAGALTELQLQKQLGDARAKAATDLEGIYQQQQKIAKQIGNPETTAAVERFGQNIDNLKAQVDVLGNSFRKALSDDISGEFLKAAKGAESFGSAVGNVLQDLADRLLKMATDQLVQQALGSLIGSGTQGGGYLSSVIGAFGGGKAAGGPVLAGHDYTINEGTPDRETFRPSRNGQIERAGGGRSLQVNQSFIMQVERGGTVPRQTQLQVGAQAARGLADAQRRNG